MKKNIIILLFLLSSCDRLINHEYDLKIIYINGDIEFVTITDSPELYLSEKGALVSGWKNMRYGVRKFEVLNKR